MEFINGIPILDVSLLNQAKSFSELQELSCNLYTIYSKIGFAYIINHGISPFMFNSILEQARLFHSLPLYEKMKIVQNEFFRGYLPLEASTLKVSTLGEAMKPNQSEAFIIAHEVDISDPDYLKINLAGPNQWPSENLLPHFKNILLHYQEQLIVLVKNIIRIFSLALGQDYYGLDHYFQKPSTFLRLQHYPPQPKVIPEHQYGISPHTDYGFLTLLIQDSVGGLQVLWQKDGSWIDVPPLPDSIILNTGDMLRHVSNNTIISTPHRVINVSGCERYSIPFFFEPNMHALITPIKKGANINPNYQPIKYADYLMKRVKGNYNTGAKEKYDLTT